MHRLTPSQRPLAVVVLLFVALVAANGYWWQMGRPTDLPDASSARIACVSYAPYRKAGETPFDAHAVVSAERIEEDLAALSRRFDCVRTYSVGAGLDAVPAIARRHGMKVLLGIWLSRTPADNERELARGILVANQNRDVVSAVIVGNEVLLRGELPQSTLAAHVRRVRDATGLPVTYADVWEFWLKYPEVGRAVSFITIHILPYWEDEPVGVSEALEHVRAVRASMQAAFPDRDILIGETGWPSAGRQRREAVPSKVNQARYLREFLNWAGPAQIRYNVIEAFDQPWKRQLEGTVGGYWGIYDDALEEKFGLQGPVVEEPHWMRGIEAGLALAALAVAAGGLLLRLRPVGLLVLALAADAVGATLYAELRHMEFANRSPAEWLLTGGLAVWTLAASAVAAVLVARWADAAGDAAGSRGAPAEPIPLPLPAVAWRVHGAWPAARLGFVLGAIRLSWLFAVSVMDLLLVFDARYRDFPTLVFIGPGLGLVFCALADESDITWKGVALEERVCALWIALASLVIVALERPTNASADLWCVLGLVVAVTVLRQTGTAAVHLVLDASQHERANGDREGTGFVAVKHEGRSTDG